MLSSSPSKSAWYSSLSQLLKLCLAHRASCALALLFLALGSATNLLFPALVRFVLVPSGPYSVFTAPGMAGALAIALFLLQAIAFFFRTYFFSTLAAQVVFRLRQQLFESVLSRPTAFFDHTPGSDLVSRLSADTSLVQEAISQRLSVLIRYSVQVVFGVVLMLLLSFRLTLFILLSVPLIVGVAVYLGGSLKRLSKEQQRALSVSSSLAEDFISGIRMLKVFRGEPFAGSRYSDAISTVLSAALRRSKISSLLQSLVGFLLNALLVVLFLYGVSLVTSHQMSTGDFTAFVLYGAIVAISFAFLSAGFAEFAQGIGAAERIFELLQKDEQTETFLPSEQAIGEPGFTLSNVSFTFPARPDIEVLSDISCTFAPGRSTAIIGPSGAGKSALVSLLLKLYEPSSGVITFGGSPLSAIPSEQYFSRVSFVPQDAALFALSIAENLRLGHPHASLEQLREVCAAVNLLQFIEGLPQGFGTLLGPLGSQLSGGQRQRLAIARALLRDPQVLILDEATSALDSENEAIVQESLASLLPGRTLIVIAHRFSTIKSCDQVIVLQGGRVVEAGDPRTLRESEGTYRRLLRHQEEHSEQRDIV